MQRLVLAVAFSLAAATAHAQKLSIQGDRFAVDGEPRFLTFMTYFGGMGDRRIEENFRYLKQLGFDGIRIWPNLDTGPQILAPDGTLRPDEFQRLLYILDQARANRLIVDVTFTYEHTPGLTPAKVKNAIVAAVQALRSYDNILIDIQNERNVGDRRFMSEADVKAIFDAVKAVHPERITTASNSPVNWPDYAADFAARLGLDVTAYHEHRSSTWYSLADATYNVGTMRRNGKPAYLQEPMSTRDNLYAYPSHDRAEYFMQAYVHARLTGAAAWCFHTDVAVDFREGPELLEDRLRVYPEPEWAFVNGVVPRIALRTSNATNYMSAEGGGGDAVRADRVAVGPWETFSVVNLSGGALISGDRVALKSSSGQYVQAVNGGGASVRAVGGQTGSWEVFIIEKPGGGIILSGDRVTLRLKEGPWYLGAESGGGGGVMANAATAGSWETFTIQFMSPHPQQLGTGAMMRRSR